MSFLRLSKKQVHEHFIFEFDEKFTSGGKPARTKGERGTCSSSSSSSVVPKRLVTCLSTCRMREVGSGI